MQNFQSTFETRNGSFIYQCFLNLHGCTFLLLFYFKNRTIVKTIIKLRLKNPIRKPPFEKPV